MGPVSHRTERIGVHLPFGPWMQALCLFIRHAFERCHPGGVVAVAAPWVFHSPQENQ